ncbi:hypothetical protein AGABI1DRAFT_124880 [Agaricus bisporus var. burnettii JB137-S8]|uniref:DUF3835 domain-containing protein n=1 Tax=Agaricus bisporus var. burnettii (strain JB137-S8 / ATCC MYA-4627 / FGSC 10392) TaxID=597362 RepID=K5X3I9_AGABU|nr:uncharacterized protein AGABI1DRAFT_124880 [Agaricus bisporus var. burnettii JB137-S8]EKM82411.1 hypothetical protein AGABI1DRAFT_124880 [Agaricus bisporus var. burnettii JB137-S8]
MPDAKDLTQSSHEAFRALINSIAPETTLEKNGKLAPEAIEKLSDKLKELIGEDAIQGFGQQRNERGELVNEEGLPIIDIEEPLPGDDAKESETDSVIQDTPLIHLSSLPSRAREKLRLQRDRILDDLEEEEHEENERQKRVEREEREEIRRKRRQEGADEKARLQRAKELQKKMGKALLQNTKSLDDDEPKEIKPAKDATFEVRNKTVTFAETSDSRPDAQKSNWGNVTAAKLRPGERPTLLQAFRTDNPLKMNVVERKSAGHYSAIPKPLAQNAKDSDDESEPDGNDFVPRPDDDEGGDLSEEPPDSDEDIGEVELENEYDLDYAQHQREIALQYYEKRSVMGPDVAKNTMDVTYEKEASCDVDLAAGNPNNQPKPSVSRFKANRIASAYGTSTHDGPSASPAVPLLPESAARTIQHAVKSGRIDDDDRLIGGNDSDSDTEAEGLREALDLLKKGELYNLGPNGHLLYAPPQHDDASIAATLPTSLPTTLSGKSAQQDQQTQKLSLPPLDRPKVSKFKVDRSQAGRPLPNSPSTVSTQPTAVSSPQRPPTTSQNAISETIVERKQFPSRKGPEAASPAHISQILNSSSPMIMESPSFSAPISTIPPATFSSSVVQSPSFPHRLRSQPGSGTTSFPMIVESPSFPSPGQRTNRPERPPTVVASHTVAHDKRAAVHSQSSPIVASAVEERTVLMSKQLQHDDSPPTPIKLSRFKQRRDGDP